MLVPPRGPQVTRGQRWWRNVRFPKIEAKACRLIAAYERRHGRYAGCVFPPELLVSQLGCDLVYFGDDEREEHLIPADAIGALKPAQRLILVHKGIEVVGREWQTVGEEIGHFVLHAKGVPTPGQTELDFGEMAADQETPALFCRSPNAAYVDGQREPVWMSREAAFFAACVQMPRERYGPVAEKWLTNELTHMRKGGVGAPLQDRVAQAMPYAQLIRERGLSAHHVMTFFPGLFDDDVIDIALALLSAVHERQVSKAAQRRRLAELGLTHDAADLFFSKDGKALFRRDEHYLVSDSVAEEALRAAEGHRESREISESSQRQMRAALDAFFGRSGGN